MKKSEFEKLQGLRYSYKRKFGKLGLKEVTTERQLNNGTVMYEDGFGNSYGIYGTGFLRRLRPDGYMYKINPTDPKGYDELFDHLLTYYPKRREKEILGKKEKYEKCLKCTKSDCPDRIRVWHRGCWGPY